MACAIDWIQVSLDFAWILDPSRCFEPGLNNVLKHNRGCACGSRSMTESSLGGYLSCTPKEASLESLTWLVHSGKA